MATTKYIIAEQVLMLLKGGDPTASTSVEIADIIRNVGQVVNTLYKTEQLSVNMPSGETIPEGLMVASYEDIPVESWKGISRARLPIIPITLPRNMGVYHVGLDTSKEGSGFAYISIAQAPISHAEGSPTGTTDFVFQVLRSGNPSSTITISYVIVPTGAHPVDATDFPSSVFPVGTLTFNPNETNKYITIQARRDTQVEYDETFKIIIYSPSAGGLITDAEAVGIIVNDDFTGRFDIEALAPIAQLEGGPSVPLPYMFRITRTGPTTAATTVNWAVDGSPGSDVDASDFIGSEVPFGTANFGIGDSFVDITVSIRGDADVEIDEKLQVTISNPGYGYSIGTASAISVVVNDDATTSVYDDTFDNTYN